MADCASVFGVLASLHVLGALHPTCVLWLLQAPPQDTGHGAGHLSYSAAKGWAGQEGAAEGAAVSHLFFQLLE